jgi:predicted transcriptional regulator
VSGEISFVLDSATAEKLSVFGGLLGKENSAMLREALQDYFAKEEKRLLEKKLSEKDPLTDLGFDEFWDGVDL